MDVAVLGGSTEFESLKTGQELGRLLRQSGHAIHTFGFGHGAIAVSRGVSVAEPDVPASDRMAPCDLTYIVWEGVSYIDRLDRLIKEPDAYVYRPGSSLSEILTVLRDQWDRRRRQLNMPGKPVILLSENTVEALSVVGWLRVAEVAEGERGLTDILIPADMPQQAMEILAAIQTAR